MTSIEIPDSVTDLGINAFSNCGSLTSVFIGDGLETIPNNCFSDCRKLTDIRIGRGVRHFGSEVFKNASSLVTVSFPNTFESFGREVFIGCDELRRVEFLGDFPTLGPVTNLLTSRFSGQSTAKVYFPRHTSDYRRTTFGGLELERLPIFIERENQLLINFDIPSFENVTFQHSPDLQTWSEIPDPATIVRFLAVDFDAPVLDDSRGFFQATATEP